MAVMFANLYAKLIGAGVLLAALAGLYAYGHHVGAASVQAQWDAAKGKQAAVAIHANESARAHENQQANDFAGIASGYLQVTSHAYPSIADALPSAVADGTVRLRDACPAAGGDSGAEATARARRADAAVTQALADRTAHSIAAVRAGDDADKREAEYRALILSLRAILAAERKP